MMNCKPLHLHVSLVPPDEKNAQQGDQPSAGTAEVENTLCQEEAASLMEPAVCSTTAHRVDAPPTTSVAGAAIAAEGKAEGDVEGVQEDGMPAMSDDRPATPWVLDICLVSLRFLEGSFVRALLRCVALRVVVVLCRILQ